MKNNLKRYVAESSFGNTYFFIEKDKRGTIHFQMDSCETDMSVKQVKDLIKILQSVCKE